MSYTNLLRSWIFGSLSPKQRKRDQKPVNITKDLKSVVVHYKKHNMLIKREPNNNARIPEMFNRTSRPCPPFCIQPMRVTKGIETIGELEVLDYLANFYKGNKGKENKNKENEDILLIDSRMENWVATGTIPCAINIPWTELTPEQGAKTKGIMAIMKHQFNVSFITSADNSSDYPDADKVDDAIKAGIAADLFDYSKAKTLVLFCNGTWCGQTSESIKSLVSFGYPTEKIKYFRNGMQGWVTLGLTTVNDEADKLTECKIR